MKEVPWVNEDVEEDDVIGHIRSRLGEMLQLLARYVNMDTSTYYKDGVDALGIVLNEELRKLGFTTKIEPIKEFGNHVVAHKVSAGAPRLFFIGHMDTVFPKGFPEENPFRIEGSKAFGPGVVDMKGGLVIFLYALDALRNRCPRVYENLNLAVVLNSDEEVGSPSSQSLIVKEAQEAEAICVLEPAKPGGELVIGRKGCGKFKIRVFGKAAHAGSHPEDGVSAIEELAHKILALHSFNDFKQGRTVNVGLIRGGTRHNVIADLAEAEIDIRVWDEESASSMIKAVRAICDRVYVTGCKSELTGGMIFPPWPKQKESVELFEMVRKAGGKLGIDLNYIGTGGCSDANHVWTFAPVIDGMGPIGRNHHSPMESLDIASLTERCQVLALFLREWQNARGTDNDV
jgi:glutamate carboxypeptidase